MIMDFIERLQELWSSLRGSRDGEYLMLVGLMLISWLVLASSRRRLAGGDALVRMSRVYRDHSEWDEEERLRRTLRVLNEEKSDVRELCIRKLIREVRSRFAPSEVRRMAREELAAFTREKCGEGSIRDLALGLAEKPLPEAEAVAVAHFDRFSCEECLDLDRFKATFRREHARASLQRAPAAPAGAVEEEGAQRAR